MEAERWHRLSDIFHRALEHEPDRRTAFLDEACQGDPSLLDEVVSLLAFHERSGDLIDTPTHLAADSSSAGSAGETLVGHTLNQYTVTRKLGEGGMGVVYLANDTRLGRPVALKALTRRFTQDDERRERLRREARAAAGLSHPGIATVYALEEFGDDLYIVSEYVPGATLREEVGERPLALRPLLSTAVEIARALAAAHERGVVHRDLKPENVIRTADGGVKVLDFGLARIVNSEGGLSETRLTETGAILGTPGYISPEQLRGTGVDFRADLFSFGVMVYELASGIHPFASSNAASTIARVLEADPPDVTTPGFSCPPALNKVIHRCLQKEPSLRYGSTQELVAALEQLQRNLAEAQTGPSAPRAPASKPLGDSRTTSLWWWQFHQGIVGVMYYLTLVPMWMIRERTPEPWGPLLFFSTVLAVGVAANLRFHLWFTSRFNPSELTTQRARVFWPVRVADSLFVLLLVVAGALTVQSEVALPTLLVSLAVGSFIAFWLIEPSTTRAAFKRRRSVSGKRQKTGTRQKKTRSSQ